MECLTGSNDFDSLLGSDIRINFLGDLFLKNQGPSPIGSRAARNYSLRQTVNLRIAIFRPHAARPAARIKSKRTPLKKRTRQLLRTGDEVKLVTILLTAVMRDAQLAKLRGVDWATRVHANKPVPEPKNRADRRRCSPRCPIVFRGRLTFLGPDREFSRKQDNCPWRVCDDALEPHSFWGGLGK